MAIKVSFTLDRDGVINIDLGYVHSLDNFKWISGAKKTIKMANDFGILVIVITNQAGLQGEFIQRNNLNYFRRRNNELKSFGLILTQPIFALIILLKG